MPAQRAYKELSTILLETAEWFARFDDVSSTAEFEKDMIEQVPETWSIYPHLYFRVHPEQWKKWWVGARGSTEQAIPSLVRTVLTPVIVKLEEQFETPARTKADPMNMLLVHDCIDDQHVAVVVTWQERVLYQHLIQDPIGQFTYETPTRLGRHMAFFYATLWREMTISPDLREQMARYITDATKLVDLVISNVVGRLAAEPEWWDKAPLRMRDIRPWIDAMVDTVADSVEHDPDAVDIGCPAEFVGVKSHDEVEEGDASQ